MRTFDITHALQSLVPGARWVHRGYGYEGLEWLEPEQTCPTEEDINIEIARLQSEYDNLEYQRQRFVAYPPINEQLDMIYWDKINGTNNWTTIISSVKSQFPKNE
jgi:hypothetical protein